jgi:hypothetical protein
MPVCGILARDGFATAVETQRAALCAFRVILADSTKADAACDFLIIGEYAIFFISDNLINALVYFR